jgi:hypothetical protein
LLYLFESFFLASSLCVVANLFERDKIYLRIGLVDQSKGRIQPGFTTAITNTSADSESESSDDDDDGDYDHPQVIEGDSDDYSDHDYSDDHGDDGYSDDHHTDDDDGSTAILYEG